MAGITFVQNSPLAKINELKGAMLLMLNTVRVLLADDHPFVREGVRDTLEKTDDIVLVGEATTNDEVLEMVRHLQPEIILLDLVMPGQPTSEIVQRLKRMDSIKILVMVVFAYTPKWGKITFLVCLLLIVIAWFGGGLLLTISGIMVD